MQKTPQAGRPLFRDTLGQKTRRDTRERGKKTQHQEKKDASFALDSIPYFQANVATELPPTTDCSMWKKPEKLFKCYTDNHGRSHGTHRHTTPSDVRSKFSRKLQRKNQKKINNRFPG
jgi:hypothetical protein